jgi:protein ImuB
VSVRSATGRRAAAAPRRSAGHAGWQGELFAPERSAAPQAAAAEQPFGERRHHEIAAAPRRRVMAIALRAWSVERVRRAWRRTRGLDLAICDGREAASTPLVSTGRSSADPPRDRVTAASCDRGRTTAVRRDRVDGATRSGLHDDPPGDPRTCLMTTSRSRGRRLARTLVACTEQRQRSVGEAGAVRAVAAPPSRAGDRPRSDASGGFRSAGEPPEPAFLVVQTLRQRRIVVATCATGAAAGVHAGLDLMEARALLHAHEQLAGRSVVAPWAPHADARALERLAQWCSRLAPIVGVDPPAAWALLGRSEPDVPRRGAGRCEGSGGPAAAPSRSKRGHAGGRAVASIQIEEAAASCIGAGLLLDLSGCEPWLLHRHGDRVARSCEHAAAVPQVGPAGEGGWLGRAPSAGADGDRRSAAVERPMHRMAEIAHVIEAERLLARLGFTAHAAIAPTVGLAWGLARHGPGGSAAVEAMAAQSASSIALRVVDEADAAAVLAALPIEALRLDRATLEGLRHLHFERIEQVEQLDRDALAQRFGGDVGRRLDEALGVRAEPIEAVRALPPIAVEQVFASPLMRRDGLEAIAIDLLADLCDRLHAERRGALRLEIVLDRSDHRVDAIEIALGAASRRHGHLWSLLRPRLDGVDLATGIDRLMLRAIRVAPLAPSEAVLEGFDGAGQARGDRPRRGGGAAVDAAAAEFADQVEARWPAVRVQALGIAESHLPEMAVRWVDAGRGAAPATAVVPRGWRPTLLLDPPEPIAVRWASMGTVDAGSSAGRSGALPGDGATPCGGATPVQHGHGDPAATDGAGGIVGFSIAEAPRLAAIEWRGRWHRVECAVGPERIGEAWWLTEGTAGHAGAWRDGGASGDRGDRREGTPCVPAQQREDAVRAADAFFAAAAAVRCYWRLQIEGGRWVWAYQSAAGRWMLQGVWA